MSWRYPGRLEAFCKIFEACFRVLNRPIPNFDAFVAQPIVKTALCFETKPCSLSDMTNQEERHSTKFAHFQPRMSIHHCPRLRSFLSRLLDALLASIHGSLLPADTLGQVLTRLLVRLLLRLERELLLV